MDTLFSPAHLHVALNHVPIIGLSVACLPILIGIVFHSRGALASGLLAVILCACTMTAVMQTGGAAYDAFMDGSIQPGLDEAGRTALRQHAHRADITAPLVYAAGILALLSLLALIKFPRQAAWIGWAVLLGCTISIGLSIWTAEAGGWIRHPEFRLAPKSAPTPIPSAPMASPAITPLPIPTASVVPSVLQVPMGTGAGMGSGSVASPATN
jgi:MFS superfamily sulfate permease-like transporter